MLDAGRKAEIVYGYAIGSFYDQGAGGATGGSGNCAELFTTGDRWRASDAGTDRSARRINPTTPAEARCAQPGSPVGFGSRTGAPPEGAGNHVDRYLSGQQFEESAGCLAGRGRQAEG